MAVGHTVFWLSLTCWSAVWKVFVQNEVFFTKIFQKISMIVFVRKFAKLFEYYGNCRHGLGWRFRFGTLYFQKQCFGIFLKGLKGMWNYMTNMTRPHSPNSWMVFQMVLPIFLLGTKIVSFTTIFRLTILLYEHTWEIRVCIKDLKARHQMKVSKISL